MNPSYLSDLLLGSTVISDAMPCSLMLIYLYFREHTVMCLWGMTYNFGVRIG
jgi:hypothetical protein